jgi:hypothetical protein
MERIAMSQSERDDLHWLKRVETGSMTQREAAEKMGVTARWVRRLTGSGLTLWGIRSGRIAFARMAICFSGKVHLRRAWPDSG